MIDSTEMFWKQFEQSGKICDYIAFKNMINATQTNEEILDADNDIWNSYSRENSGGERQVY